MSGTKKVSRLTGRYGEKDELRVDGKETQEKEYKADGLPRSNRYSVRKDRYDPPPAKSPGRERTVKE